MDEGISSHFDRVRDRYYDPPATPKDRVHFTGESVSDPKIDSIQRRRLRFANLGDVVREAESLHASGYQQAGKWDLGQVCGHLADWMAFPMDGFPAMTFPGRAMGFVVRNTIGGVIVRRVLATGGMPSGASTMRETIPVAGGDESAAIDRLRKTVARFEAFTGPVHPSPIFGKLDRQQWMQLQLVHCGHHLGFLIPKAGVGAAGT